MAYNLNQKATLKHVQAVATSAKNAIDSAIAALPKEYFLDTEKSGFVYNFTFSQATYAGATDPNLNGKPVLILAMKGIDHTNNDAVSYKYLFVDVAALADIGKADKVASATAGNVASLDANGNLVDSGVSATTVLTTADVATDAECTEMLAEVFGAA